MENHITLGSPIGQSRLLTQLLGAPRTPRAEVIHLGVKAVSQKGTEYPTETSYFVGSDSFHAAFGRQPNEFEGFFLSDNVSEFLDVAYRAYGMSQSKQTRVVCESRDGVTARQEGKDGIKRPRICPKQFVQAEEEIPEDLECVLHSKGACSLQVCLKVMAPKVSMSGELWIYTKAKSSAMNLHGAISHIYKLLNGRLKGVPIVVARVPTSIAHEGKAKIHYPITVRLRDDVGQALQEHALNAIEFSVGRMFLPTQAHSPSPVALLEHVEVEPEAESTTTELTTEDKISSIRDAIFYGQDTAPKKKLAFVQFQEWVQDTWGVKLNRNTPTECLAQLREAGGVLVDEVWAAIEADEIHAPWRPVTLADVDGEA